MNHQNYYQYQAQARGIVSADSIKRITANHRHYYDQIVLPWLPEDRNCTIAEIACGHGSFLHWMAGQGFKNIIGIDSSAEQAALAATIGAKVEQEDAIAWLVKQPDSSLDVIVGIDFAEHISKDDFMEMLHHGSRLLKTGGKIILRLPNGESPFVGLNLFNDITHVWTYTPNCLATLGRMHGLSNSDFKDESTAAIRDHRWLKVPLSRISQYVLGMLVMSAAKVRIRWWSPYLWACLEKVT